MIRTGRWLLLVLLWLGLFPATAGAQAVAVERACHADAAAGETWRVAVADPSRWRCDDSGWSLSGDAVLIRFDLGDQPGRVLPQAITTHAGNFDRIEIGLIDAAGRESWTSFWPSDVHHLATGPYITVPVSGATSETRTVGVRIVRAWGKTTLSELRLDPKPEGSGWPLHRMIAMALICGMLLVPLLINTAFYSVLPERYVIWHLVMVAAMLVQAAYATGFVHLVVESGLEFEWQASNIAFSAMAGAGLMFAASFIEPEYLDPRLRRLAHRLAVAVMLSGVACSIPAEAVRPYSSPTIHAVIGVVIVALATMMVAAWRAGSKVVGFLIVGWAPILLVGTWRIMSYLLPAMRPTEAIVIYQFALAIEVLVTALGIISRFVDVRHQRDEATARALELQGVADRDPLTGLTNRRTIEERFAGLFARGFRTMAVIDLDHFKGVNDTHGHATGDIVLRAAASALVDDRDTKAIRMGGEEFLLLLRGPDAGVRAERVRRAISSRIAADVPGLDRVVTASMGLVEHDTRGSLQIDFTSLYARCDQLLYEAKRLGRNRTMKEKVTGFEASSRAVA